MIPKVCTQNFTSRSEPTFYKNLTHPNIEVLFPTMSSKDKADKQDYPMIFINDMTS